jgi:hypothetical protein
VDVGLHHHRQQRPVDPAAGLQQGGEEGPLAQLGDLELDIARLVDTAATASRCGGWYG